MRITITARHTEIDDDLRAHARELVEKVTRLARRPHHAPPGVPAAVTLPGLESYPAVISWGP